MMLWYMKGNTNPKNVMLIRRVLIAEKTRVTGKTKIMSKKNIAPKREEMMINMGHVKIIRK